MQACLISAMENRQAIMSFEPQQPTHDIILWHHGTIIILLIGQRAAGSVLSAVEVQLVTSDMLRWGVARRKTTNGLLCRVSSVMDPFSPLILRNQLSRAS